MAITQTERAEIEAVRQHAKLRFSHLPEFADSLSDWIPVRVLCEVPGGVDTPWFVAGELTIATYGHPSRRYLWVYSQAKAKETLLIDTQVKVLPREEPNQRQTECSAESLKDAVTDLAEEHGQHAIINALWLRACEKRDDALLPDNKRYWSRCADIIREAYLKL